MNKIFNDIKNPDQHEIYSIDIELWKKIQSNLRLNIECLDTLRVTRNLLTNK